MEVAARYFRKQRRVLRIVEGIPAREEEIWQLVGIRISSSWSDAERQINGHREQARNEQLLNPEQKPLHHRLLLPKLH